MGRLSENFNRVEFVCRCGCGRAGVDFELLNRLEQIRTALGSRIIHINSGFRCPEHNAAVGGSSRSYHLTGQAADIRIKGLKPAVIFNQIHTMFPNHYGIGVYTYKGFVHFDSGKRRRWRGKS